MVVRCPKCETKLKVDEEQALTGSATFRCPKCESLFRVVRNRDDGQNGPPSAEDPGAPDSSEQSATKEEEPLSVAPPDPADPSGDPVIVTSEESGIEEPGEDWESTPEATMSVGSEEIGEESQEGMQDEPDDAPKLAMDLDNRQTEAPSTPPPDTALPADERMEPEPFNAGAQTDALEETFSGTERSDEAAGPDPGEEETPADDFAPPEVSEIPEPDPPTLEEEIEKARRFARTILSDIGLYNAQMVEEAIRNETFFDILGDEIREGMKLYNGRISPAVRETGDYFREATEEFLRKKRKDLGLEDR